MIIKMPETNQEANDPQIEWSVDYSQKLSEISININELKDGNNDNDAQAKEQLQNILTGEFITNLKDYLDKNPTELAELQNSLISILNSYPGDKNDKAYSSLKSLATQIWLKENNWTWGKNSPETEYTVPDKPTITFVWNLNGIKEWKPDEKGNGKLFSGLTREAPNEGDDIIDDDKNLYKTMEVVSEQLTKTESLLGNTKLQDDENLNGVKDWLKLVQTVVDYPTLDNVKILQEFVSKNLTGQDKTDFDRASRRGNAFDGKFWKGTLKWVNIILKKTDEYIKNMEIYLEALEKKENQEKLDQITAKDNPTITKTDNLDSVKQDLLNIPEGTEVIVELSDVDKTKLNEVWTHTITLTVKVWNESKPIPITVIVTESEDSEHANQPTSTEPLQLNNNDWEQQTYLVMKNSGDLVESTWFTWATFYSISAYTGTAPEEWQQWWTAEYQGNWMDYECYMKLDNSGRIYKVKLDSGWYLCPIATEITVKANGTKEEKWVFFTGNASCVKYLSNKLPGQIADNCQIAWDRNTNDYILTSYGRSLTIEPLTIAGDWISDDLSRCLAFINLTNYIRTTWSNNHKPDPDINRRVDKIRWIKDNDGNDLFIDKHDFWLDEASETELARYKRYNNWEHWDDNWDRKRDNKVYRKISI